MQPWLTDLWYRYGHTSNAKADPSSMTARILIVDDVPANTRLLEAKLSAEYYQVASAKDGFEALRWRSNGSRT